MKRTIRLSMLAALFCASNAMAVIIDANGSGWIRDDNTSSTGGTNELAVGTTGPNTFRALVKFDLSGQGGPIPSGNTITIYGSDNNPDFENPGDVTLELSVLDTSFTTDEANWLESSSGNPWNNPGGDFGPAVASSVVAGGTFDEDDTIVFSSADLDTAIQNALGGELALIVRGPAIEATGNGRDIVWLKGSTADNVPELNIVPEPASLALFGLGGLALLRRRSA